MPVVVTGGSWLLGRHAVAAFARTSLEVRAYIHDRRTRADLQRIGAKVAVGPMDDVDTLAAVMDGAHTVCHLPVRITESGEGVGDIAWSGPESELRTIGSVRPVLKAASRAGIRRMLLVSYPGATPRSPNPYLAGLGEAEEAVTASGIEHVMIRCTHVYGPGSEWVHSLAATGGVLERRAWRSRKARWPGSGQQVVAPVEVGDVAAVLAAADDRDGVRSGTYGLEGPDRVTADRFAALAASILVGRRVEEPGGRVKRHDPVDVVGHILASDSLADGPAASVEFGLGLTPLIDGLRRSLGATPG